MMHVLLESGARRAQRRAGWSAASVAAHAAIITTAVVLTARGLPQVPAHTLTIEDVIYVPQRTIPAPARRAGDHGDGRYFVDVDLPDVSIPSVPTFDVGASIGPSPVSGVATLSAGLASVGSSSSADTGIHTQASVERIVMPLPSNPRPDYPGQLRRSRSEGDVLVTFVVDTSGRVEQASITILQATHQLFADAVRRWLPRTRYAPAEIRGERVRQLVQQQVAFTLKD